MLALVAVGRSPATVGCAEIGLEADRFAEIGNRKIEFALVVVCVASGCVSLGVVGFEANRVAVVGDGAFVFSLVVVGGASIEVCLVIILVLVDETRALANALVEVFLLGALLS